MSIGSIRVKSLRALTDTGKIELKPITLLVGKNSVGKSTFARIFPLLRQSYEEKRRAPLLWWGKYVDFGNFDDALKRGSTNKEISIAFTITLDSDRRGNLAWYEDRWEETFTVRRPTNFELEIVFAAEAGHTYVKRTTISSGEISCSIETSHDGKIKTIISGDIEWLAPAEISAVTAMGELLPIPRFTRSAKNKDGGVTVRLFNPFSSKVIEAIGKFGHKNTANSTLWSIANRIPLFESRNDVKQALAERGTVNWKKGISAVQDNDIRLDKLRRWLLINSLPQLYRVLNDEIRSLSLGVRYLEPLRATAQRYYRPQELAVDEIDSKGENLAVYIHSMDVEEKNIFNKWLLAHLGFEVFATRDGGHISLKVKFSDDDMPTNLADTGFGVSQVLPIATQLWSSLSRRPRRELERGTSCFVVEQPELHLHPAFQEKIADLFVAAVSHTANSRPFPIVAETHSSSLINRLGELVAEGKVRKEDVQVVMFEQTGASSPVTIRISDFDNDGVLQNWPYGFFTSGRTE